MTQPDPIENLNSSVVLCKVLKDLETQAEKGLEHYGTYLKTHNGRDALQDALEEIYDLTMYLNQYKMEFEDETNDLWNIHAKLVESRYLGEETIVSVADSLRQILEKRPVSGATKNSSLTQE